MGCLLSPGPVGAGYGLGEEGGRRPVSAGVDWGEGWVAVGGVPSLAGRDGGTWDSLQGLHVQGVLGGRNVPLGRVLRGLPPIEELQAGGILHPKSTHCTPRTLNWAPNTGWPQVRCPAPYRLRGAGSVSVPLPPEGTDGLWLPHSTRQSPYSTQPRHAAVPGRGTPDCGTSRLLRTAGCPSSDSARVFLCFVMV